MALAFLVLAFAAGGALPVQAGINSRLAGWVGGPIRASMISFAVGTLVLLLLALVATRGLAHTDKLDQVPWWAWLGGALGAVYAVATVLLARELGAATLMSLVVTGQLICSVVLDHFGWVGFTEHAAGMGRLVGCLLMLAGFFLIARF